MRRPIHLFLIAAGLVLAAPIMQAAVTVGSSSWTWQNPMPQGNGLNSVSCPTAAVCFAVGDFGTILATTNSGSTWTGQASPTTRTLRGISCPNTTTCYAVGDGGIILKTGDGTTWFQQPSGTGANLNGISCPSSSECMTVGTGATLLITTNSGAAWLSDPPGGATKLGAIFCETTTECYAAGSFVNTSISPGPIQAVWQTTNAGLQWSPLFNACNGCLSGVTNYTPFAGFGNITAISVVPSQLGTLDTPVVATDQGYIFAYAFYSCDSDSLGRDGQPVCNPKFESFYWTGGDATGGAADPPFQLAPGLYGISCQATNIGLAGFDAVCSVVGAFNYVFTVGVGVNPPSLLGPSGGIYIELSSSPSPSGTSSPLYSISCPAAQCIAVGSAGAITSNNSGGTVWESQQTAVTPNPLMATSCPADGTCYSVGWNGTILATTNGGASWTKQFSGVGNNLQAIDCPSVSTCFAVGDNVILATTSSGSVWSQQSSGTTQSLNAIHCPSATVCYAAGGVILSTTNGGSTWKPQEAPPSGAVINGIACGSSTCIAVGTGGVILTTSIGFVAWTRESVLGSGGLPINFTNALSAITCLSASTCIAVGSRGAILLSTNNGVSWSLVASPTTQDLTSISCLGATCYAGTFEGQIISSFNSGASWGIEAQIDPNANLVILGGFPPKGIEASGIEGLSCASSSFSYRCLAVGSQGTILTKAVITNFSLLGTGNLTPSDGGSAVGEPTTFSLTWTVPAPQVWRDLKYLDLRLADDQGIGLLARFIPGNPSALALLDGNGNIVSEGVPGTAGILNSPTATLDLAHSSFEASGPTSPTVTVNFTVALKASAAPGPGARVYDTQILITNISGETSTPDNVGHWAVRPNH